ALTIPRARFPLMIWTSERGVSGRCVRQPHVTPHSGERDDNPRAAESTRVAEGARPTVPCPECSPNAASHPAGPRRRRLARRVVLGLEASLGVRSGGSGLADKDRATPGAASGARTGTIE